MRFPKLLAISCILTVHAAVAQSSTGFQPFTSFTSSSFDTVGLSNLNIHFAFPLGQRGGRMPFSAVMTFDSASIWQTGCNQYSCWPQSPNYGWGHVAVGVFGNVAYQDIPYDCIDRLGNEYSWDEYKFVGYVDKASTIHPVNFTISDVSLQDPAVPSTCNAHDYGTSASQTSTDGAGYTVSASIGAQINLSWSVATADGDYIIPPDQSGNGSPLSWTDRNGNKIAGSVTYQSGHQITTFIDTLGTPVLTEDIDLNNMLAPHTYTYPTTGGGTASVTFNYSAATVQLVGSQTCTGFGPWSTALVSSVAYSDGSTYYLSYEPTPGYPSNTTARLAQATLPTGGTIQYQYSDPCQTGAQLTRTLSGGIDASGIWSYSLFGSNGNTNTTVTDPTGNNITAAFSNGVETSRNVYQGSAISQNLISSVTTSYTGSPITQRTVTTNLNGLVTQAVTNYDPAHGMPTEVDEYNFGSGAPGGLLRKTTYSYATIGGPLATIYDKPNDERVYNPDGTIASETTYSYDAAALVSTSGSATQHDYTNFSASMTARGNATSVSQCSAIGGWAVGGCSTWNTVTNTYNDLGQLVLSTDAANFQTCFDYTDNYSDNTNHNTFAFLTRKASGTSTCAPSQGGPYVESYKHDWQTGFLYQSTDWNSETTTHHYDSMLRETETDFPDGGKTVVQYPPNSATNQIWTWKYSDATDHTDFRQHLDGLGRVDRTAFYNQNGWDQTDTCFDSAGRATFASYPYQGGGWGQSKVCSGNGESFGFDALGRQTSVTHSDGNAVTTTYNGNATRVQDEGNGSGTRVTRVLQKDGLGRNTSICEEASSIWASTTGACGLNIDGTVNGVITSYSYDALGNVLSVVQGSLQTRQFAYNGISQLVGEFIPEANSRPCQPTGSSTAYTECYYYDSTSKLTSRIRPHANQSSGTTTTGYSYADPLRRLKTVSYDDGTPATYLSYDETSTYGVSPQNPVGRLTSVYTAAGSTCTSLNIFSYDAVGHTLSEWQEPGSMCGVSSKMLSYTYDLAGNVISSTNGVGVTFTPTYNGSQRITQLTSSLADGSHPGTLINGLQYNAFGAVTNDTLANGVAETFGYDVRGRLTSVSAGKSATTYSSGSITVNGNEQSSTSPATSPGSGWVTFDGDDAFYESCDDRGRCHNVYDTGYVTLYVNASAYQYHYCCQDTPSNIASALSSKIAADPNAPVYASASGATLYMTAKTNGVATNYPFSVSIQSSDPADFGDTGDWGWTQSGATLTGGAGGVTTWDTGTVYVTINGNTQSVNYGQSDTNISVAANLASVLNSNSPWVTATASGNVITLTSKTAGFNTNYSVSATPASSSSDGFSPPSFSASGTNMSGGTGGSVYAVGLGYTPNGNVGSDTDSANGGWSYQYDALNRLASTTGAVAISFSTDRNSIRGLQNPGWQQSIDQTTNRTGAVTYDAAGNMTNDTYHTYSYDAEGRIVSVDGGSIQYVYDAFGRRVEKVSSGHVDYLYDVSGNQVAEISNGVWSRGEIWVGGRHVATYAGGTGGSTFFAHEDWLGTERVRSDYPNGDPVMTCTSYPYGDNQACSGADVSPYHFAGMEYDTETQLYHTPNRYYNPRIGVWMTPDPAGQGAADAGNPQSNNRYAYALNNPASATDRSGLCPGCFTDGDGSGGGWAAMAEDIFGISLPGPRGGDCFIDDCDFLPPGVSIWGGSIRITQPPTSIASAFLPGDEVYVPSSLDPFQKVIGCVAGILGGSPGSCLLGDSGCDFGPCGSNSSGMPGISEFNGNNRHGRCTPVLPGLTCGPGETWAQLKQEFVHFMCGNSPEDNIHEWMRLGAEKEAALGAIEGAGAAGVETVGLGGAPGAVVGGTLGAIMGASGGLISGSIASGICSEAGVYKQKPKHKG